MSNPFLPPLYALRIYSNANLFKVVGLRQRRTHKRRRINKKWRKRYGVEQIIEPQAFRMGNEIHAHPSIIAQIEKEMGR